VLKEVLVEKMMFKSKSAFLWKFCVGKLDMTGSGLKLSQLKSAPII